MHNHFIGFMGIMKVRLVLHGMATRLAGLAIELSSPLAKQVIGWYFAVKTSPSIM
jgi:hypothetical protein